MMLVRSLPVFVFALGVLNCRGVDLGPNTPGEPVADIRTMDEELEYVRARAQSLELNEQGYWEATFDHGIVMIYVPAGEFRSGNDALHERVVTQSYPSSPAHEVQLSHYWIAKTPVTRGQFRAFVDDTGFVTDVEAAGHDGCWVYEFGAQGFVSTPGYDWRNAFERVTERFPDAVVTDEHPVNCVSWFDGVAYADWLAQQTGLPFRLPTEAQWEYAARGNDGRAYPWGDEAPDGTRANYADESFDRLFPGTEQSIVHRGVDDGYPITSPVGLFPAGASPIGALDMAGNLTEWVHDYLSAFSAEPIDDPIGAVGGDIRAQKGGFWAGSAGRIGVSPDEVDFGHNIRADSRQGDDPRSADDHLGFRVSIGYLDRSSTAP